MRHRFLWILPIAAVCALLAQPSPAMAGGGAHITDDDATLPAGVCQLESWLTFADNGRGLAVANPACTLKALPRLEIATAVQSSWGEDGATAIAPAVKLNLRSSEEAPIGIALSAMAIWNPSSSRVETVAVNVPISTRASDRLVIHGNLGWIITPADTDRDTLFLGVQAEYELTPDLVLMGELFSNDGGAAGGQAGLRWVRDRGRIDFDLLAGHRTDGTSTSSVTLGFTIRR